MGLRSQGLTARGMGTGIPTPRKYASRHDLSVPVEFKAGTRRWAQKIKRSSLTRPVVIMSSSHRRRVR